MCFGEEAARPKSASLRGDSGGWVEEPGVQAARNRLRHTVPRKGLATPHPYLENPRLVLDEGAPGLSAAPPLPREVGDAVVHLEGRITVSLRKLPTPRQDRRS